MLPRVMRSKPFRGSTRLGSTTLRRCSAADNLAEGPRNRTAFSYGHPRKKTIALLQQHVSKTRPAISVQVATAKRVFTTASVTRALYGTGWDGPIVLEADLNGNWKIVDAAPSPSPLVNINTASVQELMTLPMIGHTRATDIVT